MACQLSAVAIQMSRAGWRRWRAIKSRFGIMVIAAVEVVRSL